MMIILEFSCNAKASPSKGVTLSKTDFLPFFKRGLTILEREKKLRPLHQKFSQKNPAVIQLTLTDDPTIQILNADYRGIKKPTDVLSFSYYQYYKVKRSAQFDSRMPYANSIDNLMGEIIISLDTAKKQAKEHHKTLKQELQFLFVHGFLHIFDYDHEELPDRTIMFDLQDEILGTKIWRRLIE